MNTLNLLSRHVKKESSSQQVTESSASTSGIEMNIEKLGNSHGFLHKAKAEGEMVEGPSRKEFPPIFEEFADFDDSGAWNFDFEIEHSVSTDHSSLTAAELRHRVTELTHLIQQRNAELHLELNERENLVLRKDNLNQQIEKIVNNCKRSSKNLRNKPKLT